MCSSDSPIRGCGLPTLARDHGEHLRPAGRGFSAEISIGAQTSRCVCCSKSSFLHKYCAIWICRWTISLLELCGSSESQPGNGFGYSYHNEFPLFGLAMLSYFIWEHSCRKMLELPGCNTRVMEHWTKTGLLFGWEPKSIHPQGCLSSCRSDCMQGDRGNPAQAPPSLAFGLFWRPRLRS